MMYEAHDRPVRWSYWTLIAINVGLVQLAVVPARAA